jgi:hypothetical protein
MSLVLKLLNLFHKWFPHCMLKNEFNDLALSTLLSVVSLLVLYSEKQNVELQTEMEVK